MRSWIPINGFASLCGDDEADRQSPTLIGMPAAVRWMRACRSCFNLIISPFLPNKKCPYEAKAQIQADFVTQANRQDIVTTSARNEGLAKGIAAAFVKAVLQLCDHGSFRFQWMRYFPREDAYPWDSFWRRIITDIETRLKDASGTSTSNCTCQRHPPKELERNGDPIFADIEPPLYLKRYRAADLNLLTGLGLGCTAMDSIVAKA